MLYKVCTIAGVKTDNYKARRAMHAQVRGQESFLSAEETEEAGCEALLSLVLRAAGEEVASPRSTTVSSWARLAE